MGATVSRTDFEWSYTQEPHATRRKEMLSKSTNNVLSLRSFQIGRNLRILQNPENDESGVIH